MTWKIVGASKASVLYIYIDKSWIPKLVDSYNDDTCTFTEAHNLDT